jgi:hypothetical protein
LLVVDDCDVKGRQVAEAYVIRTLCTLQPFSKFLLSTLLAQIPEKRTFRFIVMFVLEDRHALLASSTDTIPLLPIVGVAFKTPDKFTSWYTGHRRLPSWKKRGKDTC